MSSSCIILVSFCLIQHAKGFSVVQYEWHLFILFGSIRQSVNYQDNQSIIYSFINIDQIQSIQIFIYNLLLLSSSQPVQGLNYNIPYHSISGIYSSDFLPFNIRNTFSALQFNFWQFLYITYHSISVILQLRFMIYCCIRFKI